MSDERVLLDEVSTHIDDRRFFYRTAKGPDGSKPIVHVHGFGISGRYLVPTAERLAAQYATYVPDLPGFGHSKGPRPSFGIPELADAIARFMDHVELDRATLLGNSLGCPMIAEFAHRYPERLEQAILCSPAGGPNNTPAFRGIGQILRDALHEPPKMWWIATTDYLRYGIVPAVRLFGSMLAYPTLERFFELELRTLIVVGSLDPLVDDARITVGAAALPQVTLAYVEGAPHAVNYTHPGELANIVRSFMEHVPITDDASAAGTARVVLEKTGRWLERGKEQGGDDGGG